MLPKKIKLPLRQYPDFFITARRQFSALFTLFFQPSDQFRVLIIVPKKACALASERNKIKRLFSEALLSVVDKKSQPPLDAVFSLKRKAVESDRNTLVSEIERALSKLS